MVNENDIIFFSDKINRILGEISRDMVGQRDVVEGVVIAVIAGGLAK